MMTATPARTLSLITAVLLAIALPATAGPPLICHPLEIGDAESLPTVASGWQVWKARYDARNLVRDTTQLLSSDTPVIVRMETIRRAVVHGKKDVRALQALANALKARTRSAGATDGPDPLALFDYGYFVAAYNQFRWILDDDAPPKIEADAYSLVTRAIELRGGDPEMDLAAAILSVEPKRRELDLHIRRAAAAAKPGSLLGVNVLRQFKWRSDRVAELRELEARMGTHKL